MKVKLSFALLFFASCLSANNLSVAGFHPLQNSGREVYNFNNGWRFIKGDIKDAEKINFDDKNAEVVAAPHTVQLMPVEASGNRNYQGIAWYRKKFVVPVNSTGKQAIIHFEAIMGKQQFYLNGKLIKENFNGYLPVNINLTDNGMHAGDTCLIAVKADNSDDKSYPPGKPQYSLDFAYHGGMYRDVWLILKNLTAVTDANEVNKIAGGGIFIHYDNISNQHADVLVDIDIENKSGKKQNIITEVIIKDKSGKVIGKMNQTTGISGGTSSVIKLKTNLKNPTLWSPENPYLYQMEFRLKDGKKNIDGGIKRFGIRKAEFRGKEGFFLNGQKYHQLIGGNRHQDFAYVGNAVPNSQQWRDAKRLRDAGCTIIRSAHYPLDPSFMDACDELGMFVIVCTPGWQYWNKDPNFEALAHQNTRNIIRRDRNHPSVIMWEPILNETRFPLEFSLKALQITKEEYPYPGAPPAVADMHSAGVSENYGVVYGWPEDEGKVNQSIFCREFGENVDDWYAHNANNRAARHWGEKPMKVAALSLADTYDRMHHTTGQFIGGAQWHPFDHQRGYHPDPYWGGIFDAFRQPKYAYYLFKSQQSPKINIPNVDAGPMVFILNEMTPFSDTDVVVFSNCDSVRLTSYEGRKIITKPVIQKKGAIPYAPVVFESIFDFWEMREQTYGRKKPELVSIVAEGIIDGKVVCREKKMPSRRSTKIRLSIDKQGHELIADGSDFIIIVAEITDDNGNVRRLAKDEVVFTVEGEGKIIGDATILANPRQVEFGSAPVLIKSTTKPGKITVKAHVLFEGTHAPAASEISFESIPSIYPFNHLTENQTDNQLMTGKAGHQSGIIQLSDDKKKEILKEVEVQQTEFGVKK